MDLRKHLLLTMKQLNNNLHFIFCHGARILIKICRLPIEKSNLVSVKEWICTNIYSLQIEMKKLTIEHKFFQLNLSLSIDEACLR